MERLIAAIVLSWSFAGVADADPPLTRERVIELARVRAPAVRIAAERVAESRGRLTGARVLVHDNPVLEIGVGPRWALQRTTDYELALSVPIELGGRRDKRIASASADVDRDAALARDAAREMAGAALEAYYRVLHAEAVLALARQRRELAEKLRDTADSRRTAGDATQLDVNLAESEVSRAESDIASAEAQVARARGELASVLGLSSMATIAVEGDLADRSMFDAIPPDGDGPPRPDVIAAEAGVRGAEAEVSLADTLGLPDVAFRVSYVRESDGPADILLGGVSLTIPSFVRGQGPRAETRARRRLAEIDLEARRAAVASEVEAARGMYRAAVEATRRLEEKAVPLAIQNEDLARQSYEAGKLDLVTLLVVRREALDTRRQYLDELLEAALAGVDLSVAVGAVP